jgi:YesN/AraC family two-component response regulator
MIYVKSRSMYLDKSLKTTLRVNDIQNFMTINIDPEYVDIIEMHDFWEMVYIESGEAIAMADDGNVPLFPGDVIFHKPGEVHSIKSANGTTAKAFFICFHTTNKSAKIFESLKIALENEQKQMIYRLYDEARKIYLNRKKYYRSVIFSSSALSPDAPTGAQQLFKNHLEEFLISVIQLVEKSANVITYESKEELEGLIYQKMLEKISAAVYSSISVEDVLIEFNYGKTYLSQLFKKHCGLSIMQYYNSLKIKEAKKLIKEGKLTMAKISEKLGFNNQYYFSRVFKKVEGISPSEYKEKVASKS